MGAKNIEAIYQLSPQQQGMLFESFGASGSGIHIEQMIRSFTGGLDFSAFERAWQAVIDRHSILRTAFAWKDQDEPLQIVLRKLKVTIERLDWRGLSSSEKRLEAFLDEDRQRGFDLSKPPAMRFTLIQMNDDRYDFIWTLHHILMDGWCLPIIDREFFAFYQSFSNGEDLILEPGRPYRDYIAWLKRQDVSEAERFWRGALQGFTKPTSPGVEGADDSASPQVERFGTRRVLLRATTTSTLRALVKQNRVTLSTLVHGVWALLLNRYSGQQDVVLGTTVSGRPSDLAGAESMLGLFINTVPLRVKIQPRALLWPWLEEIQQQHLELRRFEYCSTGQVHQWSEVPGSLPLYESILIFQNYPVEPAVLQCAGLKIDAHSRRYIGAHTGYALTVLVADSSELILRLVYDGRRFHSNSINRVADHFLSLLESIAADPRQDLESLGGRITAEQIPTIRPPRRSNEEMREDKCMAPRTATEEKLARIWSELLGISRVGLHDNFFTWGGHSLLGTQLMSRVRSAFEVELPLRCLFDSPTIVSLAEKIESARQDRRNIKAPALVPVARDREPHLSFAQQRLWFLSQLEPENPFYNTPSAFRLSGTLNVEALQSSLDTIISRHEALRTRFPAVDGKPIQVIAEPRTVILPLTDLTPLPEKEREREALRLATEEARRPFDLAAGPVFRASLLRMADDEHILMLNMHHIVSDGWSAGILFRELGALYEAYSAGRPSPLAPLPIQYADYTAWQAAWLETGVLEEQLEYWRRQLATAPATLEIATDRPRPSVQSYRGAKQSIDLSEKLSQQLRGLSQSEGVTPFMTLMAAFQLFLHRHTGQERIIVGTDVANRNRVETEGLIGFFVNLLPICADLTGNPTFKELLSRVREVSLGAYAHQDLPFEKLVEEARPERELNRNPLVQVLFVMQNVPGRGLELRGLTLKPFEVSSGTSRFDLALFMYEADRRITGTWVYSTDLFDAASVRGMSRRFESLLEAAVAQPDRRLESFEMLTEFERNQRAAEKLERGRSHIGKLMSARRRAIDLSSISAIKMYYLADQDSLPLVLEPAIEDIDLPKWAALNSEFIEQQLLRHGALLFRGFGLDPTSEFEDFARALCPELFGEYGDLPREKMGGNVYGSTPYPADTAILFHNESSHMHRWPIKIWFFCVKAAEQGGETPILDCRKVYQLLDPKIRERFTEKKLMYVRNYTDGLDVSWQTFFRTTDRAVVENYCRKASIDFQWRNGNGLRTRQIAPAVAKFPKTGEMVFFNQIQLHHVSCLDPAVRESLLAILKKDELPRNVYYGDGSPIEDSIVGELGELYQKTSVSFPWREGDILMLNNMMVAHGRKPYAGARKIVVAMGEMIGKEHVE